MPASFQLKKGETDKKKTNKYIDKSGKETENIMTNSNHDHLLGYRLLASDELIQRDWVQHVCYNATNLRKRSNKTNFLIKKTVTISWTGLTQKIDVKNKIMVFLLNLSRMRPIIDYFNCNQEGVASDRIELLVSFQWSLWFLLKTIACFFDFLQAVYFYFYEPWRLVHYQETTYTVDYFKYILRKANWVHIIKLVIAY